MAGWSKTPQLAKKTPIGVFWKHLDVAQKWQKTPIGVKDLKKNIYAVFLLLKIGKKKTPSKWKKTPTVVFFENSV